jgi:hypothetical protein
MNESNPPAGVHIRGTNKGEEIVFKEGREPGRHADAGRQPYRHARDATGINASAREPIDPRSPSMPPA